MADITWSAYALAMFTPEQRAAAVAVPPPDEKVPVVLQPATAPVTRGSFGVRVEGLDPNIPNELQEIQRRGWRFEHGEWTKIGVSTVTGPIGPNQVLVAGSSSFQPSAALVPGGSVLGFTVPTAPAVLLPSFIGGRVGRVSIGEGLRPESGGGERVRFGRFSQVRGLSI